MLFVHDVLTLRIPSARLLHSGQITQVEETGVAGLYNTLITDQAGRTFAFMLDSKRGSVLVFNGKRRNIVGSFEKRMHC